MKTLNDFKVAMLMAGLLGTTASLAANNTQDMTVKAQVVPTAEIVAQTNTIDFGQISPNSTSNPQVEVGLCLYSDTGLIMLGVANTGGYDGNDATKGHLTDGAGHVLNYQVTILDKTIAGYNPKIMPLDGSFFYMGSGTVSVNPCTSTPDYTRASVQFTLLPVAPMLVGTYNDKVTITVQAG